MDYERLYTELRGRIEAQRDREEASTTWLSVYDCGDLMCADDYLDVMDELEAEQRGSEYRLVDGVYQRETS
jgi:hypothetical protein